MENNDNQIMSISEDNADNLERGVLVAIDGQSRATSGTIVNNFRSGYRVQITWSVNSQNASSNTSNITVKAQLVSTGSSYSINSSATKNGSLTINGTKYTFTFNAGISGNQTKTVYTKTVDVAHNSDGTKTVALATTLGIAVTLSGTYYGNVSASGNAGLNTIPRASSFSLSSSSIDAGKTITVNISRASDSFTHKVFYSFGENRATISTNATTSASYAIPIAHLNAIPNATSGTATISVDTYNGGTLIGSASKNFTITAPASVKPTFSSLSATVVANGADTSYGYVKGKSKCKLVINGATGAYGSTIKSYSISGGGFSSSNSSFTTGGLTSSGNIVFTATVTDSRGRRSDEKTVTISVLDYNNPNITNFSVIRCTSNGTANDDGTYIKIAANYTYSTLNNKNSISSKVEFKQTSASSWTNGGAINSGASLVTGSNKISTNSSYDVRLTITDKFTNVSKSVVVPTAFVTLDFKKGGKGIAFGKASEADNLLEVAMPLKVSSSSNCVTGDNNTATTAVSDLNKLWKSGFYDCDGGSNIPFSGWNWVIHSGHRSNNSGGSYNYGMQIAGQNGTNNFAMRTVNASGAGTWNTLYHTGNKPTWNDIGGKPTIISDGASLGRLTFSNWIYSTGNTGWYNSTYGGGWYMSDSTWLRVYNDKAIYSDGTIRVTNAEHRYLKGNSNGSNQNLDITVFDGKSIYLNPSATSGCAVYLNRNWSGSSGSEPSFYNTKGKGWGFIGNSENTWYRVYGAGGSVSDRIGKYEILKADIETQYDNVKTLNIYNYRTISSRDMSIEEIAETFFNTNFIDSDNNYITKSVEIDGKKYQEIDDALPKEKIKEIRTKEIIDNNPHFEGCMREDLSLGCMVDEMPLETIFYDNEGGDGKAVDMYSYTTMILGATKHLITKVETLERENEELKNRLDKMEELLNGIINKE